MNYNIMALFTIEQVELIRRLRNSGVTKEQVAEAFDQLEKLENERFSSGNSYCLVAEMNKNQCPPTPDGGGGVIENCELEELKRKGDAAALSEIRHFVMKYNIKQTMIADMTRMSQAYVSRFFRGDIQDLPERTKNTFFLWYLNMKHKPWVLAQMCSSPDVKKLVSEGGDLVPLRRERFTFKAPHLTILERQYEKDPYPDVTTRELIVEECNRALHTSTGSRHSGSLTCASVDGRHPTERELVTLPVVNNWFNNRRKEAKKRQQMVTEMTASWYSPYNSTESGDSQGFSPEMITLDLEERIHPHIKQEA